MRKTRIDKIVVSAVKQSHKAWKPVVNELENFKDFIHDSSQGQKVYLSLLRGGREEGFLHRNNSSSHAELMILPISAAQEGAE